MAFWPCSAHAETLLKAAGREPHAGRTRMGQPRSSTRRMYIRTDVPISADVLAGGAVLERLEGVHGGRVGARRVHRLGDQVAARERRRRRVAAGDVAVRAAVEGEWTGRRVERGRREAAALDEAVPDRGETNAGLGEVGCLGAMCVLALSLPSTR